MSSEAEERSGSDNQQAVASLPTFSELFSQLRAIMTRDKLAQGMDKLLNLYLPIVYTYVTYRVPALGKLGAFLQQTPLFLTLRQRILLLIAPDAQIETKPKAVSGSENGGPVALVTTAHEKITDKLVDIGDKGHKVISSLLENTTTGKVIGKIVDKTVTGKVIKRLVTNNRARISEGEEEEEETRAGPKTENRIAEPESQPDTVEKSEVATTTTEEADRPSVTETATDEVSPSTGRKIIFPSGEELQAALPLPSPSVTSRLEDRGPEGWREAQRLNSVTLDTHL